MENGRDDNFNIPRLPLPSDVFEGVNRRMRMRRIEAQKSRLWMATASFLLLVLAGAHVGIILSNNRGADNRVSQNETEVLYEAYFKSTKDLFNE